MRPPPQGQPPATPRWAADTRGERAELRCGCGSLMARLLAGDIELKCRRCKRVVVLQLTEGGALRRDALQELGCLCEEDLETVGIDRNPRARSG